MGRGMVGSGAKSEEEEVCAGLVVEFSMLSRAHPLDSCNAVFNL